MGKKCIICSDPAIYVIKGTSDFYCPACAEENFDDISALNKISDILIKAEEEDDDGEEDDHRLDPEEQPDTQA